MLIKTINDKLNILGTALFASIAYGIKFYRDDFGVMKLKKEKDWAIEQKIHNLLYKKVK